MVRWGDRCSEGANLAAVEGAAQHSVSRRGKGLSLAPNHISAALAGLVTSSQYTTQPKGPRAKKMEDLAKGVVCQGGRIRAGEESGIDKWGEKLGRGSLRNGNNIWLY